MNMGDEGECAMQNDQMPMQDLMCVRASKSVGAVKV